MRFRTHDQACFQNLTSTRVESSSECFANGSITALVVKVEAATQMIPSQLTLRDPSCKPTFSNNRLAYFSFNASSCRTTRKVCSHFMSPLLLVEMFTILSSCIRLPVPRWYHDLSERSLDGQQDRCCPAVAKHHKRCSRIWVLCSTWVYSDPPPSFFFSIKSCTLTCFIINISVMVVCNYKLTETLALMFSTVPQARGLHAAPGLGELHVRMRLARGRLLYTLDVFTFYSFEPYGAKQYFSASLYCSY